MDQESNVTLYELETTWSLDDLERALAIQDYNAALYEALKEKK